MVIGKKKRSTRESRKKERIKEREKQRKKMIRTRYGQKQKKHARKGVLSCLLAGLSAFLLAWIVSYSFAAKGNVSFLTGVLGLLLFLLPCFGCSYAVRGFKERDKNYITCKVGAACNGAALSLACGIFIRGFF